MKRLKLIRELFPLTKGYRTTYFLNFFLVIISGIMKISTPFFVLQVFDVAITKLIFIIADAFFFQKANRSGSFFAVIFLCPPLIAR